jgi:hypothetical protein
VQDDEVPCVCKGRSTSAPTESELAEALRPETLEFARTEAFIPRIPQG